MLPDEAAGHDRLLAALNYAFLLAAGAVIAAILTAALVMQYAFGELPCPLCLLQRVAMLGVAFGILQNLRHEFSSRNTGISLIFALLLLVVAARQTLLDIYPRPGHMPVWSVLIALALSGAYAAKLVVLGGDAHMRGARPEMFPAMARLAGALAAVLIGIAAINLVSALFQCGLGECHTMGYALLPPGWGGMPAAP